MSARAPLLSSLLAAHLVLFGAAVVAAWAEDTAPVANHTDAEAAPIDASIAPQGPSHFRHELKSRDARKYAIAHPSGNAGDHHRTFMRGSKVGVVRNAIGQPIHPTSNDIKATKVKASERITVDGALKNASSVGNGGTEAVVIDSHPQGFVPLRANTAVPRDPRLNTAMNHSIIGGRDMVRPGLGAGAIGGPAKNVAGVISGNNFRPRHP